MEQQNAPDYRLQATITAGSIRIESILCDLYLPKRLTDPIRLHLKLTSEQGNIMTGIFQFSVAGTQRNAISGLPSLMVQADTVYSIQLSTQHLGFEGAETLLIAEPIDLRVIEPFERRRSSARSKVTGGFWLTPSFLLRPAKSIRLSDTGDVRVRTVHELRFKLPGGPLLMFDTAYRHETTAGGETLTYPELVARFESKSGVVQEAGITLSALDDILMLTSLAERHRCVCLGWDISKAGTRTRYFRREITIPKTSPERDMSMVLIDLAHFEEFLNETYAALVNSSHQDLLRQAIHRTIPREDQTIESQFLTLYSALETLVLMFSKDRRLEYILHDETEWTRLRKDMERWLRNRPELGSKDRRRLVYEKLNELNRVSFGTAFSAFCDVYGIDLKDLWPVTVRSGGSPLSAIRNRIIHGEHFERSQLTAISVAKDHLRWVVERSVLAVLGWRIDRSKVNPSFLQNFASYEGWTRHQTTI